MGPAPGAGGGLERRACSAVQHEDAARGRCMSPTPDAREPMGMGRRPGMCILYQGAWFAFREGVLIHQTAGYYGTGMRLAARSRLTLCTLTTVYRARSCVCLAPAEVQGLV